MQKHFERNKGWGFIETEDGEDYFFNLSNVRLGQNLNLGDIVKFDFLFLIPCTESPIRIHNAYVRLNEIEKVMEQSQLFRHMQFFCQ